MAQKDSYIGDGDYHLSQQSCYGKKEKCTFLRMSDWVEFQKLHCYSILEIKISLPSLALLHTEINTKIN